RPSTPTEVGRRRQRPLGPGGRQTAFYPTFRTEALILVNFLSVKPHISLSQELQQVQVLVGQIEHEEPLPRDVEHMNSHKVVEDPSGGGRLNALAFLVRKGGLVLLERVADTIL